MSDLEVIKPGEEWFTPPDQMVEGAKGVRYLLRAPTLYDKSQLARAIAARGAQPVPPVLVKITALRALEALRSGGGLADDEFTAYADLIERAYSVGGLLSEDDQARYLYLLGVLRAHHEPLAAVEAQQDFYKRTEELEAVRFLVRGWENFERGGEPIPWRPALDGGTAPDLLDMIPDAHRIAIAFRLHKLRRPAGIELKNSQSPSSTRSSRTSSTAKNTSRRKTRQVQGKGGRSRTSA